MFAGTWHTEGGRNVLHTDQFYAGIAWKQTGLDRLNVTVLSDTASEAATRLNGKSGVHVEPERFVFTRADETEDPAPKLAAQSCKLAA